MYRVYKDFLERMLVIAVYFQEAGHSYPQASEYVRTKVCGRGNTAYLDRYELEKTQLALRFLESSTYTAKSPSTNALIGQMTKQLLSGEPKDRDLIDTIVRVLGLPYSRNVFAGNTISQLREAILLPEEIADFKQQLAKEMYCYSCGHRFQVGEMSTYISNGGAKDGGTFCCTRCNRPTSLAADNDKNKSIPVTTIKGLENLLKKQHFTPDAPAAAEAAVNEGGLLNIAEEFLAPPPAQPAFVADGGAFERYNLGRQWIINDIPQAPGPPRDNNEPR